MSVRKLEAEELPDKVSTASMLHGRLKEHKKYDDEVQDGMPVTYVQLTAKTCSITINPIIYVINYVNLHNSSKIKVVGHDVLWCSFDHHIAWWYTLYGTCPEEVREGV